MKNTDMLLLISSVGDYKKHAPLHVPRRFSGLYLRAWGFFAEFAPALACSASLSKTETRHLGWLTTISCDHAALLPYIALVCCVILQSVVWSVFTSCRHEMSNQLCGYLRCQLNIGTTTRCCTVRTCSHDSSQFPLASRTQVLAVDLSMVGSLYTVEE